MLLELGEFLGATSHLFPGVLQLWFLQALLNECMVSTGNSGVRGKRVEASDEPEADEKKDMKRHCITPVLTEHQISITYH